MLEIIAGIIPYLKEIIMTYGLYETTICLAVLIILWQLPALLNAITRFKNHNK